MTAQEIRRAYIDFFVERGHKVIPRASLVPYNDPTTLFTGSGMQPLISYLLGETHPAGSRIVNSQTCLRAQDIDEVGDNRHTTFFEMLGNWSFGDYTKSDEIPWLFEFLTNVVGLDPTKLYVTCYVGNQEFNIPKDSEAAELWAAQFAKKGIESVQVDIGSESDGYSNGMQNGRIFFYDGSKNWWSRAGAESSTPLGEPGGPDTEVFYDFGTPHDIKWGKNCHPNCECGRFLEIANSVFMAFKRTEQGFEPLAKPNVDFGGGLERMAVAAIDNPDVFKISLLKPIISKLEDLSGKTYDSHTESMRVITDHLRAATFLAVDGITPSNKEQGYVMRRLMRRAIRQAFELGIEQNFLEQIVPVIADLYADDFEEVVKNREKVISVLTKEEKAFRQTLRKGLQEFQKLYGENQKEALNGEIIFKLYDTYGFPVELTLEEAFTTGWKPSENWKQEFENKMNEQRERSQTASKGVFKGGLGGQTLQHKKYHTATHLMYQALRDVLGDHVIQRGSNITEERLRFDFSHSEKMTPEQIKQVEEIVNEQIDRDLNVSYEEYATNVAIEEKGALGQFGDRYGDTVKVYKMIAAGANKPYSFEICGGPHVVHTSQLAEGSKRFKIIKEESSSAGIRRIKAVLA
ncbi:MAG TPA: alanine--tRNA ligase [Candidatus Saccharimonadales bacterium]|nr:alanine--tRNA ligase [Candidatus Saccharimonadales bacterium]